MPIPPDYVNLFSHRFYYRRHTRRLYYTLSPVNAGLSPEGRKVFHHDNSRTAIIIAEGYGNPSGCSSSSVEYVPYYGSGFRLIFSCHHDSYNVLHMLNNHPLHFPIPVLYGLMTAQPTDFEVARSGQPYNDVYLSAQDMFSNANVLFDTIDESFMDGTGYDIDIIVPRESTTLSKLLNRLQGFRYEGHGPYYDTVYVFVARSHIAFSYLR